MIDSIAVKKKKKVHLFIIKWQLSQNVLSERQSIACFYHLPLQQCQNTAVQHS